jgi:hypothetical protein
MSDTAYNEGPAMMAARNQTYGKRKQQEDAQRAVPMRQAPTDVQARQAAPARQPVTPLGAPTARPTEPITSGAPFGPGANMIPGLPMGEPEMMDDAIREMRAIYELYPSQELAEIIQFYEDAF